MSDPHTDAALAELLDDLGIQHHLPMIPGEKWDAAVGPTRLGFSVDVAYGSLSVTDDDGYDLPHTIRLPKPYPAHKAIRLPNGVELPVTDEILDDLGW